MDYSPPGFSVRGDSPGKNMGVGCHALLQGIFATQGSNPGLPHCRWILCHLSHQGCYVGIHACAQLFSRVRLFVTSWIIAPQASLSMGFSRQEYWSGLPFPTPGDLSDPGVEPESLAFPALAGGFFTTAPPGTPIMMIYKPRILVTS